MLWLLACDNAFTSSLESSNSLKFLADQVSLSVCGEESIVERKKRILKTDRKKTK